MKEELLLLQAIDSKLCEIAKNLTGSPFVGDTVLNPPVDAPAEGDPLVLINRTAGKVFFWDGNSWETIASGPKEYVARVDLFTGNNPSVIEIYNSLGGSPVFVNIGGGYNTITLAGAFPENKIFTFPDANYLTNYEDFFSHVHYTVALYRSTDDEMILETSEGDINKSGIFIRITVFP